MPSKITEQEIEYVLSSSSTLSDFYEKIGLNTLPEIAEKFPHHKTAILDKILADEVLISAAIRSKGKLEILLSAYPEPENKDKIYQKILEVGHWTQLGFLSEYFPSHDPVTLLPYWNKTENCCIYIEDCFIVRNSKEDAKRALHQIKQRELGHATQPEYHNEKLHISIAPDDYEKATALLIPMLLKQLDGAVSGFKHTDVDMLNGRLFAARGVQNEAVRNDCQRLLSGDQFTLYFPYNTFDKNAILELCKEINSVLIANNIKPGVHAVAELPLSPHLSFRLEQFEGKRFDPTLFSVNKETAARFQAVQSASTLYQFLSENLRQQNMPSTPVAT